MVSWARVDAVSYIVLVVLLHRIVNVSALDCPAHGFIVALPSGQQRCYWFINTAQSYDASKALCGDDGGTLAIIDDSGQDTAVLNYIRTYIPLPTENYIWLGFHDKFIDGEFWNENGVQQTYFHWAAANPSTNKECASINTLYTDWHDLPCTGTTKAMCSKDSGVNFLSCPSHGFIHTSGSVQRRCYWFINTAQNYDSSNVLCANDGGTLAIIDDSSQDTAILNYIRTYIPLPTETYIWLGFHDKYVDGQFWNEKGNQQTFFHWAAANPSTNKECGSINTLYTDWHDLPCTGTTKAMCSKDPEDPEVYENEAYYELDKKDEKKLDGSPISRTADTVISCATLCRQNDCLSFNYLKDTRDCILNKAPTTTTTNLSGNRFYIKR